MNIKAGRLLARAAVAGSVLVAALAGTLWWLSAKAVSAVLNDGSVVQFRSDSQLKPAPNYPHPRWLQVDGEFLIKAAASADPLTVRSRLMVLTIRGASELHIVAHSKESGEQVEVLFGDVTVHKNYPSTYREPDHLGAGEMSMVNQTIDLLEKETFDPSEARNWGRALR